MKRPFVSKIIAWLLAFSLFVPSLALATSFNPNYLISDEEFTDSFSMELGEIQTFLEKGYLAEYRTEDLDGKVRYASDIIWRTAQNNGVNPKVILVMLQKEQGLITDDTPTQDQLDWALGYGVCDSCTHADSAIQRWRGFAKQINSTTLQFTEGYFLDLEEDGETVMGYAPGVACTIDGTTVVPANNATAALYTYTPHLTGNRNFATIWQTWFARNYPTGSLLQDTETGGVWLIQYGERRPITSRAALLSRFNEDLIIPVSQTELESYSVGRSISLPNYSLLHTADGGIYLLVDDAVRHIDSMEAFRAIGFSTDDLVEVTTEELLAYETGQPITDETIYPQGALIQDPYSGGVYYVENNTKHAIYSREILTARFGNKAIVPAKVDELWSYDTGAPVKFNDGTLVGATGQSTVYLISEGARRPIVSETVFLGFGFKWENVIWTNENSLNLHPLGEVLDKIGFTENLQEASRP
ncbi:MAG: hypothetical protein UX09_C0019G0019 [Candidatus Uhrbacteria bacterium GW2011_GWE2_45_35]|uniref:Curculin domain protein (Mannose-binding) lectin n=2 Tax=Candidatus Uhriibacteriota TaxID=1752732 RepID=A0A0G1JJ09_9BACT|nr:MAG: hypothetical protein UW63_C0018G0018 [Candidatus Uhrbacteria bacterium GW2011_GWF2_44_350]KKU08320.1 MAG: hypothetical protein UX09_C0019G0019 [Candidatus Uhrbacteria bacterium GW2011_GWE2_45_35]HBR81019.1 hypothetical protein [Candidatus Uhrbacteria bacterium]HCU31825.1 hypothetical protein [Candidatus Uhrbacteria bacterium]